MVFKKYRPDLTNQKGLIEACKKNNSEAQLKLYDLYYKAMYTLSINMVTDAQLAEDLMQEAFLKAFTNIKQFKGDVSFGAWLKKIVINKCLDHLKKKKIHFENIDELKIIDEPLEEDERNAAKTDAERIRNEITNLPQGYQTILSLFLLEGFDHNEIASILGITASTSRSQYTRAKALLVKRLNKK